MTIGPTPRDTVEPELEEEAALQMAPWRVVWEVTLPRCRASIAAATLFVALQTAGDISVTAVGTAFDVRREPNRVTVTVEEGTVEIAGSTFAKIGLPTTWRAEAGYQLTYSSGGRTAMR